MMELGYLYIIFLFSFVSATPYGYGTKGGAIAKASATSSAFGGQSELPLSVPAGSGFSGSFSKSSSSSFSSSSASSSSSSSSFTFGGASSPNINNLGVHSGTGCGANGCQNHIPLLNIPSSGAIGIGETSSGVNTAATAVSGSQHSDCEFENCYKNEGSFVPGSGIVNENQGYRKTDQPAIGDLSDKHHSGCSSGSCHQVGANIISATQSASVAGVEPVKIVSNTDSTLGVKDGSSFLNKGDQSLSFGCNDGKCSTFGANYKPHFTETEEKPINHVTTEKCSSADCISNADKERINSPYSNTNDIPAKNIHPESTYHSKHNLQHQNFASEPKSDCTFEGCGSSQAKVNSALSFSGTHDHNYPSNCRTPDCASHSSSSTGAINDNNDYKPPVTFLQTPKVTTCFSPNCQQESQAGETKPSSYDVPIHGGIHNLQVDSLSSSHETPSLLSHNLPTKDGSSNCKTLNCPGQSFIQPGSTQFKTPPTYGFDSKYSGFGLPSSNAPTVGYVGIHKPNVFNIGISPDKPVPISQGGYPISTTPHVQYTTETIHSDGFSGTLGSLTPHPVNIDTESKVPLSTSFIKPNTVVKPSNVKPVVYTGGFGAPPGLLKPNEFNVNLNFATPPIKYPTTTTPNVKPSDQKLPTYTGGFGGSSGLLKPHEFDSAKPINSNTQSAVTHTGLPDITKPIVFGNPTNQNLPTYTSVYNGPTLTVIPNKLPTGHSSTTANSTPFPHIGQNPYYKPSLDFKPLDQQSPTYTNVFGGHSGLLKPNKIDAAKPSVNANSETSAHTGIGNVAKPVTFDKPLAQNFPTYTGSLSQPTETTKTNELNSGIISSSVNSELFPQTEHIPFSKPVTSVKPLDQNLPGYTGGFGGSSGLLQLNNFDFVKPSVNAGSAAVVHQDHPDLIKPIEFGKPSDENLPTFTGGFGGQTDSQKSNVFVSSHTLANTKVDANKPHSSNLNIVGFNKPSELFKPGQSDTILSHMNGNNGAVSQTEHSSIVDTISLNKPTDQKLLTLPSQLDNAHKLNTDQFLSTVNVNTDIASHDTQTGYHAVTKPNLDDKPSNEQIPIHTDGFSRPSGLLKPNEIGSDHSSDDVNIDTVSQAAQPTFGSPDAKPPKLPTHTNSFSGSTESGKSNDFNTLTPINVNVAPYLQSQKAVDTSSVTKAEAVAYSGGFGGPPGLLKPNDDGRLSSNVHSEKVILSSQCGDKYETTHSDSGSTNGNIDTTSIDSSISDSKTTGTSVGLTSLGFAKNTLKNIGSVTGLNTGDKEIDAMNKGNNKEVNNVASGLPTDTGIPSIAISQASASASATAAATSSAFGNSNYGQDTQVFDDTQKTTVGCCGGGVSGSGADFGFGGSLPKPGYDGGWNNGLSAASASAKSTSGASSGARAFNVGGGYASSSASAHASSGYPTKGGYGK